MNIPPERGARAATVAALALVAGGLVCVFAAIKLGAAAEVPGTVPGELIPGARAEVRNSVLVEVLDGTAPGVRPLLAGAGALLGLGCGWILGLVTRGPGSVPDRIQRALIAGAALASATVLVLDVRDAPVAAQARSSAIRLAPIVALASVLAVRPVRR